MHDRDWGKPPPCGACPMPHLHHTNDVVWEIFSVLRTQMRVSGMGEFLGYDFALLPTLLTSFSVPVCEWSDIIEDLNILNNLAVNLSRKAAEENTTANKK